MAENSRFGMLNNINLEINQFLLVLQLNIKSSPLGPHDRNRYRKFGLNRAKNESVRDETVPYWSE